MYNIKRIAEKINEYGDDYRTRGRRFTFEEFELIKCHCNKYGVKTNISLFVAMGLDDKQNNEICDIAKRQAIPKDKDGYYMINDEVRMKELF